MTVSICIIALNEGAVLNGLFRDISNQDYPHNQIEVVLVDSFSKDNTLEMMNDFKNSHYGFMDVKIVQNNRGNQGKDTFHHLFFLSFYVVFLLAKGYH